MSKEKQERNNPLEDDQISTEEAKSPSPEELLEKSKQDYLYLAADFENYKKNAIKERSDLIKYGNERLLRELLEVADNFERALESEENTGSNDNFKTGVEMIFKELTQLLSRFGVTEIETKGKPFDPTLHEALSSEMTDRVPPGHVTQVFKKAYKFNDRLLRPAQVVVSIEPQNKE